MEELFGALSKLTRDEAFMRAAFYVSATGVLLLAAVFAALALRARYAAFALALLLPLVGAGLYQTDALADLVPFLAPQGAGEIAAETGAPGEAVPEEAPPGEAAPAETAGAAITSAAAETPTETPTPTPTPEPYATKVLANSVSGDRITTKAQGTSESRVRTLVLGEVFNAAFKGFRGVRDPYGSLSKGWAKTVLGELTLATKVDVASRSSRGVILTAKASLSAVRDILTNLGYTFEPYQVRFNVYDNSTDFDDEALVRIVLANLKKNSRFYMGGAFFGNPSFVPQEIEQGSYTYQGVKFFPKAEVVSLQGEKGDDGQTFIEYDLSVSR